MRNGFSAVRPYVYGPHSILAFVTNALVGKVLVEHELGGNANHIEVKLSDSLIVLELCDPPHASCLSGSIYVYVPNVDAVVSRAVDCDVEVFSAAEDKPYEERQVGVKDAYGNVCWVATYQPNS